jgi:alpha-tubulin suppressor-like RCC1 family protein
MCLNILKHKVGNLGQLGLGEYTVQNFPQKIILIEDKQLVSVCAGRKHAMALSTKKRVFAWGSNEYSQVGVDKRSKLMARKLNSANSKSPSSTSQISTNSISPKMNFDNTPTSQEQNTFKNPATGMLIKQGNNNIGRISYKDCFVNFFY